MNKELYDKIRRLEARTFQLEEFFQEMSSFISNLETECNRTHENLSSQVNTALKEISAEIKTIVDKVNTYYKDSETRLDNLETIHGISTKNTKEKDE